MRRTILCAALLVGCGGSLRSTLGTVSNTIADAANAGGEIALDAMCVAELRAVAHRGHRVGMSCVRDDAASPATAAQMADLAKVRAQWSAVRLAYAELATAQDVLVAALQTADGVHDGNVMAALGALSTAYQSLVNACVPLGLKLPSLLGGR